jgi:hypothetical protein
MRCRFALLLLLCLPACGGYRDAMNAFDEGRYPDAVGDFRRAEADFSGWSEPKRANYALYRGLCHLAVGDARETDRWLSYAKELADRRPELFSYAERGRLLAAWRTIGRMPGERR